MTYKGYNISDIQSELLLDILQVQKDILEELKKLNAKEPAFTIAPMEPVSTEPITALLNSLDEQNVVTAREAMSVDTAVPEKKTAATKKPAKRKRKQSTKKTKA
jgi:hypothetical protein